MNEYEIQRVIRFLQRTRSPWVEQVMGAEPDSSWNIITHLIQGEIAGEDVTISTLVGISGLTYTTALRKVHRMIDDGIIVKRLRSPGAKSFTLHPSETLFRNFVTYARQVKVLLAETFGRSASLVDDSDYYFGGSSPAARVRPPSGLIERQLRGQTNLKFLLHDDNYFASMRNMWVDFRSNLASRKDFEMRVLPALYQGLVGNGAAPQSTYDVVTVNMPWITEMASRGMIRPLDDLIRPDVINPDDFQPSVWQTGSWQGRQYAIPIYVTIEVLAARRDLFEADGIPYPRTFDETIKCGRAFHAPQRDRYGIVWNAAPGMPIAHTFMFFLGCCGETVTECGNSLASSRSKTSRASVRINTDAGRKVLDYMHRLVEISPPGILDLDWEPSLKLFMQGRAAMSYVWSMRATRFEYDIHSVVKRRVEYLPHPAGPGGTNLSPMGGFLLALPTNMPDERVAAAFEAIAWMASPEAMKAHVKNGFPLVPRFSVAVDPEAAASSSLVNFIDKLARRRLLGTHQRPAVPHYTSIENILGEAIHRALRRECSDVEALTQAQSEVERLLESKQKSHASFEAPVFSHQAVAS
jgi:ABC-type glycerol-3-phosphate transport system substrate-binding protein